MKTLVYALAVALFVSSSACDHDVWPAPQSWMASLNGVAPSGGVLVGEGKWADLSLDGVDGITLSLNATSDAGKPVRIVVFSSVDAINRYLNSEAGAPVVAARGGGIWAYALIARLRPDVSEAQLAQHLDQSALLWMRDMKSTLSMPDLSKQVEARKPTFRGLEGLRQKLYLSDRHGETISGLYFWDSRQRTEDYLASDFAREIPKAYVLETEPDRVLLTPHHGGGEAAAPTP